MNTELVKLDPSNPLALEATATTPMEMQACQSALIVWCEKKIISMKAEAQELSESFAEAVKRKWKSSTLKRHADLAMKRVTFYEKIKAALDLGYCIVPNFPITLFAIRTDKTKPASCWSIADYHGQPVGYVGRQEAKILEAGDGEYHPESTPLEASYVGPANKPDEWKKERWELQAKEWGDIEFPINMAKPQIMEATGQAMAAKIFDELGILPDPKPKKDPMIIGTIIDPRGVYGRERRRVSFIIAWHLNVRDL